MQIDLTGQKSTFQACSATNENELSGKEPNLHYACAQGQPLTDRSISQV